LTFGQIASSPTKARAYPGGAPYKATTQKVGPLPESKILD
jgi:hypothetical protein